MTIGDILYTIIITPLQLLFEFIYSISYNAIQNPVINIITLSLAVNLLVLPLYRRADVIQREARDTEQRLRPMIDHIKKNFKGDEKVMMLQAYYREQHYSPLQSLKSTISLLLQIPFFIAAYQFLSHLSLLNGQSVGPVEDLSKPDGLIVIGTVTINLLPVLMTVINIVSSEIYTRGQPFKDKIVLYLSAAIFLVLLYDSPSGLVFYWTLNNLFSLGKNIVYSILGIKKKPAAGSSDKEQNKALFRNYILSAVYLFILIGLLIPSALISSCADDFVYITDIKNPIQYVIRNSLISFGVFIIWMSIFYFLSSKKVRAIFSYILFAMCGFVSLNYFVYSRDMGLVSTELVFDYQISYEFDVAALTALSAIILAGVLFLGAYRFRKTQITVYILLSCIIAVMAMSITNIVSINKQFSTVSTRHYDMDPPSVCLSRNSRNVVVIMLDRAIGVYIPEIMAEKPELMEQYDGFVYYPNTVSYGVSTNVGSPPLYGGYEYTPAMMNSRDSLSLKDKQNEALLLMPLIFTSNGFDATTVNPPYVNYSDLPNVDIFDDYPDIHAYITREINNPYYSEMNSLRDASRFRNLFFYCLLKVSPPALHPVIYNEGNYNSLNSQEMVTNEGVYHFPQIPTSDTTTKGINAKYFDSYNDLSMMSDSTVITDDGRGYFYMMDSIAPHEPNILQTPDYTLSDNVDNTGYTYPGTIQMDSYIQVAHYHSNMAALIQLGKWFDYLRENGVWDNTKIIIVSDHGRELFQCDDLILDNVMLDAESVNPLLMVKDFNSNGFEVSDEFMTNADVPSLAFDSVIDNPVNPFTGNIINSDIKNQADQIILVSDVWNVKENNGNTFLPGRWYSVHDSIFDQENWEYLGEY